MCEMMCEMPCAMVNMGDDVEDDVRVPTKSVMHKSLLVSLRPSFDHLRLASKAREMWGQGHAKGPYMHVAHLLGVMHMESPEEFPHILLGCFPCIVTLPSDPKLPFFDRLPHVTERHFEGDPINATSLKGRLKFLAII